MFLAPSVLMPFAYSILQWVHLSSSSSSMVHLDCYGTTIIIIYGHLYGYDFCCPHMHGHQWGWILPYACVWLWEFLWSHTWPAPRLIRAFRFSNVCIYVYLPMQSHHQVQWSWSWLWEFTSSQVWRHVKVNLLLCMAYICLFFHPHSPLCLWFWLWQFLMINMGGVTFSYMHLFLLLCMIYECNCMYQGIGINSTLLSMSPL